MNQKPVTFANLKEEIAEQRALFDNTTMLIIQADEKAFRGQVVKVMDIAKEAGIIDLVVATEPKRVFQKFYRAMAGVRAKRLSIRCTIAA